MSTATRFANCQFFYPIPPPPRALGLPVSAEKMRPDELQRSYIQWAVREPGFNRMLCHSGGVRVFSSGALWVQSVGISVSATTFMSTEMSSAEDSKLKDALVIARGCSRSIFVRWNRRGNTIAT